MCATAIAMPTTTSDAGTTGKNRRRPSTMTSELNPTSAVSPLASSRFVTMCQSFWKKSPDPPDTPKRPGSCPTMIVRASPTMKPFSTGSEMRLATNPRRRSPASSPTMPAVIARAAVTDAKLEPPEVTTSATVAAESAAVADIGPTTRCRELPNIA